MIGPNLSEWALKHRSFTVFLMIVVTAGGLASYLRLGRNEDPAFTFRTMIVQASWPGATLDDTRSQVTERLERKLQETQGLDFLRGYTSPVDLHTNERQRKHRRGISPSASLLARIERVLVVSQAAQHGATLT